MKVEDLIKKLEKLPKGSTIGSFDELDMSINDYVTIYEKDSEVYGFHEKKLVSDIENGRYSNASKICDFYIGY